jgi:site-specific DNA-methyltransferase (adenine-specific)
LTLGATTDLVWDKGEGTGMGDLSLPWRASHERLTFGVWNPYPSKKGCGAATARLRRGSVLRVNSTNAGQGAKRHPTEKPVMLLRQLIEASSLFDETVLDPFMGAGSTLEAAKAEGRKAIGIEVEERYCEVAANRMGHEVLALM